LEWLGWLGWLGWIGWAMAVPPYTIIDNTYLLTPSIPTYEGGNNSEIVITTLNDFNTSIYAGRKIDNLLDHYGTHLDAPYHFGGPGTKYVNQISASQLTGIACVVDVRTSVSLNDDYAVTIADLLKWEGKNGAIPKNSIVVMKSGWGKRWSSVTQYRNADDEGVMHFPGFSPEAAKWLLDQRDVLGLAVDTLSIDIGSSTSFSAHQIWNRANKWALENLANVETLPESGALMVIAPLFVINGTGSTARVYSFIFTPTPTPSPTPSPAPSSNDTFCQLVLLVGILIVVVAVGILVYRLFFMKSIPTDERNMTVG